MSKHWGGYYPPPPQPFYPYYGPTQQIPPDQNGYVEFLKGQLKEAKKAAKKEKAKKPEEKKKEFWRKAEVASILFMTAPILAMIEIGIIKLCLMVIKQLMS